MVVELILLVGLVLLLVSHRRLAHRLTLVERLLREARQPSIAFPEAAPESSAPAEAPPLHAPTQPVRETLSGLFERLVGGRLLIWIGGIALAAGGIFLIRHSIELVTPEARMIAAAGLGLLLLALGEYARAGRLFADDPRIGQTLVGAGIAILYATVYGSYLQFGLIGSGTASALMLLVTGAALALSLRHGAPTAALGLTGGFGTPFMVGDPDAGAIPVLAYLGLLDAALFAIAWRRGWTWLAASAVLLSFAWTGYFMLEPAHDALPAGLFAALLGILAALPRSGESRPISLLQPAIIALAELTILVGRGDLGLSAWALFGAMATAAMALSKLRPDQRFAPVAALLLTLILLAFKGATGEEPLILPWAAAAATLLFAGGSASLVREGPLRALTACAGLAGPLLIMRSLRPELLDRPFWGALTLAAAGAAFALLLLIRPGPRSRGNDIGSFGAASTGTLLVAVATYDLASRDGLSAAWLVAAIGLLLIGVKLRDKALRFAGLLLLTGTTLKVFLIDAAALEGVWRILSFLGLGVALIGIGKLYTRVLSAEAGRKATS
jgi:uncharacterized membrane protein